MLIDRLADGGRWTIPMNGSVWQVDKQARQLKCVAGPDDDDMFDKITSCCQHLGYATVRKDASPTVVLAEDACGTMKLNASRNIHLN